MQYCSSLDKFLDFLLKVKNEISHDDFTLLTRKTSRITKGTRKPSMLRENEKAEEDRGLYDDPMM